MEKGIARSFAGLLAIAVFGLAPTAACLAQVSAPLLPVAAPPEPATSVSAFGPRKMAAAPGAQDPQKWYPLQPAIPCNTTGLLTPGQYEAAWQACSDRAFNVEHSG
jgi:hypothetical protein